MKDFMILGGHVMDFPPGIMIKVEQELPDQIAALVN
jgi:hypothetical protein